MNTRADCQSGDCHFRQLLELSTSFMGVRPSISEAATLALKSIGERLSICCGSILLLVPDRDGIADIIVDWQSDSDEVSILRDTAVSVSRLSDAGESIRTGKGFTYTGDRDLDGNRSGRSIHKLVVPLSVAGRSIGAVTLARQSSDPEFTSDDLDSVNELGFVFSALLEFTQLSETTKKTNSYLADLISIEKEMSLFMSVGEVATAAAARVIEAAGAEQCVVTMCPDGYCPDEGCSTTAVIASAVSQDPEGNMARGDEVDLSSCHSIRRAVATRTVEPMPQDEASLFMPRAAYGYCVPLVLRSRVLGVMLIGASNDCSDSWHIRLYDALASKISSALERARLYEAQQRRAEMNSALTVASHKIIASESEGKVAQGALLSASDMVGASTGMLIIEEHDAIADYRMLGMPCSTSGDLVSESISAASAPWVEELMSSGETAFIHDVPQGVADDAGTQAAKVISWYGMRSLLILPLFSPSGPVGSMVLAFSREHVSAEEIEVCESLASLTAVAMENRKLIDNLTIHRDELLNATNRLDELDRLKTEFVAVATHEIQTPLAVVLGYLEVTRNGLLGPVNLKQEEKLGRAQRHIEDLSDLATDLLDMSRLESRAVSPELGDFLLSSLVEQAAETVKPLFDAKEQSLHLLIEDDLLLRVDGNLIKRALINILHNSSKFSFSKGIVQIMTNITSTGIEIIIRDDGPGVSDVNLPYVFERFFTSRSKNGDSTGLGLSIVKAITEAHGGEVWMASEPGSGAEVHLRFPLKGVSWTEQWAPPFLSWKTSLT